MKKELYLLNGVLALVLGLMLSSCHLPTRSQSATGQPSPQVPSSTPSETPTVSPENEGHDIGQAIEPPMEGTGVSVAGWLGYIVSNPEGAQYDDYVVILPEGVGKFGIEGANEAVTSKIADLRDKDEPGKYAHFWGTLTCDAIDYNGCQLLVTQVRSGTEVSQPEPIEGWEGKIYGLEPGMQFDDYFVLEGDYPIQYGIASYIAENGLPVYAEELASLRDTGEPVGVSGQLICGVPDSNGCQIQVSALEVNGTVVDPYQGWLTYTNEVYGYRFRYPADATITEGGVEAFPSDELPEGMSADQYLQKLAEQYSNKLCVSVRYSFGYINISPPANEGFRYAICGRTGVGVGELVDKSEQVYIAGQFASADGFEFIGTGEMLPEHNETLVMLLPDGTRVEYGAIPAVQATFEEYLLQAKPILIQILSTYELLN
jgi:hypothetical protein